VRKGYATTRFSEQGGKFAGEGTKSSLFAFEQKASKPGMYG
jgi:hypothetical protein